MKQKIRWLIAFCPHTKPKHRMTIDVPINYNQCYTFKPGKLLDQLKPFLTSKRGFGGAANELSNDLVSELFRLPWFEEWLDGLCTKRQIAWKEPSLDEQINMLVSHYDTTPPSKNEIAMVERADGESEYKLNATTVLEKLATNIFSEDEAIEDPSHSLYIRPETKELFFKLPWSNEWYKRGIKRREVARMRKLVTKDMKLQVLLNNYRYEKPKWKSHQNIVYDSLGQPFQFFVGTWLDDIVENFTPTGRPSVVLDEAQRIAVRSLPWFDGWISSLIRQRQLKPFKKAMEEDDDDALTE